MNKTVIIMTLFSSLFGAKAQYSDQIKIINAIEFKSAISKKNVQLIDVRTAREFKVGHITRAVNIDFFQKTLFVEKFSQLDKQTSVYLYCRSGSRSQKAARKLVQMGFSEIFDLKGGYLRWQ